MRRLNVCGRSIRPVASSRKIAVTPLRVRARPRSMSDSELAALLQLEEQQQGGVVAAINRDLQKAFSVRSCACARAPHACVASARSACIAAGSSAHVQRGSSSVHRQPCVRTAACFARMDLHMWCCGPGRLAARPPNPPPRPPRPRQCEDPAAQAAALEAMPLARLREEAAAATRLNRELGAAMQLGETDILVQNMALWWGIGVARLDCNHIFCTQQRLRQARC